MTGFWHFLFSVTLTSATPMPGVDARVNNLALVGVIHVQGANPKGQSLAVVREKSSGRTRMLHKGDNLVDADLEVRELGPQHIVLVRGTQTFILRVESEPETTAALSHEVETLEIDVVSEIGMESLPENESKNHNLHEPQAATSHPDCERGPCTRVVE